MKSLRTIVVAGLLLTSLSWSNNLGKDFIRERLMEQPRIGIPLAVPKANTNIRRCVSGDYTYILLHHKIKAMNQDVMRRPLLLFNNIGDEPPYFSLNAAGGISQPPWMLYEGNWVYVNADGNWTFDFKQNYLEQTPCEILENLRRYMIVVR